MSENGQMQNDTDIQIFKIIQRGIQPDTHAITHTHIAEGIEISALFVSGYCRINAVAAQHGQAQCVV